LPRYREATLPETRHGLDYAFDHVHDSTRGQRLFARARALIDVQPLYLGRRAAAARSGWHGAIFHQPQYVPSPQIAVWVSIAVHLLGGIGILVGFMTRWAAALLILLCLGTAFGVHLPAGDMDNMMNFYKNLVMAGGLLYVIAYGQGAMSLDKG
jgi:uncharacterized membrane protein YphA (DoxX/SURF4 family)